MEEQLWTEHCDGKPLLATAVHAGHVIRTDLLPFIALDEATRLREEDPHTETWATVAPTWLVPRRSRFEVDLNRPRDEAVYLTPEDAWGLAIWKQTPDQSLIEHSLAEYDAFYKELNRLLREMCRQYKHFIVFDLHSYNYRRDGPGTPPGDQTAEPDVNIGTGTITQRPLWQKLIDRFIADLRRFDFPGHQLDIRENVKFKGRHLPHWIHQHFPGTAAVLSLEFKKFFMDEWTGEVDAEQIDAIRAALESTVPGILEELQRLQ